MNRRKLVLVSFLILTTILTSLFFLKFKQSSLNSNLRFKRGYIDIGNNVKILLPNKGYAKIISINDTSIILLNTNYTNFFIKRLVSKKAYNISPRLKVDLPKTYFMNNGYVLNNNGVVLFCGNCSSIIYIKDLVKIEYKTDFTFSNPILINNKTFIFRKNSNDAEFTIGKYNFEKKMLSESSLGINMVYGGGLATDGKLIFDKKTTLYFINYYNSKITKFDTSLNIIKTFHTVDQSVRLPKITYLAKTKSYCFLSPHPVINNVGAVFLNNLYINSEIHSSNDKLELARYKIIDVYNSDNGKYIKTIYLNNKFGDRIIDMVANEKNTLDILTEKYLLKLYVK